MFALETFLMQTDIVESTVLLLGVAGTLIGTVAGIVATFVKLQADRQGRKLSAQEQKIVDTAEFTQLGVQKAGENIGEIKALGTVFKKMALTPEQQKILDEEVAPIINVQTERIKTIQQQIPHFTKLLGVDVNQNQDVPRESATTLRKINEDQR